MNGFRSRRVQSVGPRSCDDLPEGQMAFVVIGRPYTLWDPALNMDIGKKIQDLGILAIPQDFLPLEDADISDVWPKPIRGRSRRSWRRRGSSAHDVRLRAVVLTYFACGPDSFGNPFFKDEIGEPCYVMQIDEHTADAGVITRIEAFADTATQERREGIRGDQDRPTRRSRDIGGPQAVDSLRKRSREDACGGLAGLWHRGGCAAALARRRPQPWARRRYPRMSACPR